MAASVTALFLTVQRGTVSLGEDMGNRADIIKEHRGVAAFCCGHRLLFSLLIMVMASCAVAPPVQEMSDARQAITAAREARAETLAPQRLRQAESSLEQAARDMEQGHYIDAREAARVAREEAIRARDEASRSTPSSAP